MSKLVLTSDLQQSRQIRPWLETLELRGFDLNKIELALVELVNNIIQHGYGRRKGEVRLRMSASSGKAVFTVDDNGVLTELPDTEELPPEVQIRGYGLHIIRQLSVETTYERVDGTNIWRLEFAPEKGKNPVSTLVVSERLDVVSSPRLRSELIALLEGGVVDLTVDLSRTTFCDSSGLATLVAVMKQARDSGGDLTIIRPTDPAVWEVFELTQFDKVFNVAKG